MENRRWLGCPHSERIELYKFLAGGRNMMYRSEFRKENIVAASLDIVALITQRLSPHCLVYLNTPATADGLTSSGSSPAGAQAPDRR